MGLTRPWRSSTAWMVLLAGTLTSPAQAAHQQLPDLAGAPMGLVPLQPARSPPRSAAAAGWHSAPAAAIGRSGLPAHAPCSARRSCTRSCARCRTRGTYSSSPRHPERRATKRRRSSITELSFHGIDTFPRAIAGGKCYPCLRYKMSPMSRVGQLNRRADRSIPAMPWRGARRFGAGAASPREFMH